MKQLKFINRPVKSIRESYLEAISIISNDLIKNEGVKAIYQFGNITTPGISDIDLLVVAKDNFIIDLNGFENLPSKYKNLFTHGILGVSESFYERNNYYNVWSENHLIAGQELKKENAQEKTIEDEIALKHQIAIEYLVINYIDLKIQIEYGVVKLRSLLQHLKGIKYDLEFLNIKDCALNPLLEKITHWIKNWFEETPSDKVLSEFIHLFDKTNEDFLIEIFSKESLYLPETSNYRISKKINLVNNPNLQYSREGILVPLFFNQLFGNKFIKLQNKFNSFEFQLPITHTSNIEILKERFLFLKEMKKYNIQYLPNFSPLISSITAKII